MKLSNKAYDILKDIALILPLVITFVEAIIVIWKLPYATQIGLTLGAINTLVAGLVKISCIKYNKNK